MVKQRSTGRQLVGGHRRLSRVAVAGGAVLALTCGLLGSSAHQAGAQAATPTTTAYVTGGKVAVVNTASGTVTNLIAAGAEFIALDPTGAHAYVTITGDGGVGSVKVIDTSTKTVTATVPVGLYPRGIAVDPSDTHVYVSNRDDLTVSVIDTSSNQVTNTIPVNGGPQSIAFDPTGSYAYVATDVGVDIIDTSTQTVETTISGITKGHDVIVDPFGSHLYVSSLETGTVAVIDTSTNTVTATITLSEPMSLALSPYADKLYVTELTGAVAVIDTATNTITQEIQDADLLQSAWGIAVSADGTLAYVTDVTAGDIAVIDTTTEAVSGTITDPGIAFPQDVVMNGHPQLSAPGAPTDLKAKATKASVTLTWMDHGHGITNHQVQAFVYTKGSKKSGGPTYDPVTAEPVVTGSAASSYVYDGLTAGRSYVFKVRAVNTIGTGDFSNYSNTVTIKP